MNLNLFKIFTNRFFGMLLFILIIFSVKISNAADNFTTGIYSNMAAHDEEDISGMEVFIIGSRNGYFIMVQCSSGEPQQPFLIKASVNGQKISAVLPKQELTGCNGVILNGVVKQNELDLVFDKNSKHIKLKKGLSFWSAE